MASNSDIVKGSKLMVFYNGSPIGFATSHSLSVTTNTTEVSTKDHGDYPAIIAQSISWEITAENLYSDAGEAVYMTIVKDKTPVNIVFAPAENYSNTNEPGVIDSQKVWQAGTAIASGKALITSFSINAPSGDNATMSVTFTGVGELTTGNTPGPQGT
jgi:hypothetical protein